MKIFRSHFWYNKRQRNGIFFLFFSIVLLQLMYWYVNINVNNGTVKESKELIAFQKQIDSLKSIEIENRKFKLYPFNPNFISDFKGYTLGMTLEEIDRLHEFRKKNKYVNSAKEFQSITKVSDSLLAVISPYFKFPDWVTKRRAKSKRKKYAIEENYVVEKTTQEIQAIEKININTAKFKEVLRIPEIDYELCKKIFEYRDEVAELQDISELKNIKDFPIDKYDIIILYLEAK